MKGKEKGKEANTFLLLFLTEGVVRRNCRGSVLVKSIAAISIRVSPRRVFAPRTCSSQTDTHKVRSFTASSRISYWHGKPTRKRRKEAKRTLLYRRVLFRMSTQDRLPVSTWNCNMFIVSVSVPKWRLEEFSLQVVYASRKWLGSVCKEIRQKRVNRCLIAETLSRETRSSAMKT